MPSEIRRLAVRCDGGAEIGAGHVARCLPLATAFASLGWTVTFVGRYDDFAAWLLERAGQRVESPAESPPAESPCGVESRRWDAAIVDLYGVAPTEICALACRLPIATLGEASRCDIAGVVIDYHLDRIGVPDTPRLLAGPGYAPIDPAFAGAGRAGDDVETVLITVGASEKALAHVDALRRLVAQSFPAAEPLVPRGDGPGRPIRLLNLVGRVDLAVTAAGLTSYELACAGIPQAAVGIVDNQRRVVHGLRESGLAAAVDLSAGEDLDQLAGALQRMRDRDKRRVLSKRGREAFDGRGSVRAAAALIERWPVKRT